MSRQNKTDIKEKPQMSIKLVLIYYHKQHGTYYFRTEDKKEKIAIRPKVKLELQRGQKYNFEIEYNNS